MKTFLRLIQLLSLVTLGSWAYAYDFKVANEDGVELAYRIINKDSLQVAVTYTAAGQIDTTTVNYPDLTCDSISIPESVKYNAKSYIVCNIDEFAFANVKTLKKVMLPKTISSIGRWGLNYYSGIEEIFVSEQNPTYTAIDGVLYSKDMKHVCVYPSNKKDSVYIIPEGPQVVKQFAFYETFHLIDITMPLSLKELEFLSMVNENIRRIVFQDSVKTMDYASVVLIGAEEMVLGNQVEIFNQPIIAFRKPLVITCRTKTPPYFPLKSAEGSHLGESTLYVPRQSLSAYQQAEGWKLFGHILPIEPPIIVGMDTAEVSWVQNFSATGYVWTLYTDEAKTKRFMSLTFDANGHLTHIDINNGHMPARMPALYSENGEEERRFAEYYSFTISGLSPETRYYYTRQSMNGTTVIDEDTGSFQTLSEAPEGIDEIGSEGGRTTRKIMEDGQVLIKRGKTTYTLQGTKMK